MTVRVMHDGVLVEAEGTLSECVALVLSVLAQAEVEVYEEGESVDAEVN